MLVSDGVQRQRRSVVRRSSSGEHERREDVRRGAVCPDLGSSLGRRVG